MVRREVERTEVVPLVLDLRALRDAVAEALVGIQHQGASPLYWKAGDYTVAPGALADPWLRNTGFLAGAVVPGIVSVESDTIPGDQSAASTQRPKRTPSRSRLTPP